MTTDEAVKAIQDHASQTVDSTESIIDGLGEPFNEGAMREVLVLMLFSMMREELYTRLGRLKKEAGSSEGGDPKERSSRPAKKP